MKQDNIVMYNPMTRIIMQLCDHEILITSYICQFIDVEIR
jgi:hypothetical protein